MFWCFTETSLMVRPERELFACPIATIDKVYHFYWRVLSCAMFLFRGADRTVATTRDSQEQVHAQNRLILEHRQNFDKDVEVLCKLCEEVFGALGCTPNLHSLHHMIRRLIVLKGHPTFEMIVERLVSFCNYVVVVVEVVFVDVYVVVIVVCIAAASTFVVDVAATRSAVVVAAAILVVANYKLLLLLSLNLQMGMMKEHVRGPIKCC